MSEHDRWRWRVAPALLLAVALVQLALARGAGLSPWSGGGFGMFSTADAGGRRHVHASVLRPGLEREVAVPPERSDDLLRLLAFPTRARAEGLARALTALPSPDYGPASAVRIQIWRTRFAPETLAPSNQIVREFEVPVGGG